MEELVDAHDVWVSCILKNLQLAHHQVFEYLMLMDLVFSYYLDRTFDIGRSVLSNPHLAEAAFTEHSPNLIAILNIFHLFESFEIFEGHYMLVPLFREQAVLG